jgi:hypothetical protein
MASGECFFFTPLTKGSEWDCLVTAHPPEDNSPVLALIKKHTCPTCSASYKIKGDLARHQHEKHTNQEYLCPVDKCPNSIVGEGFARNSHLIKHLMSKKHNMAETDAAFLAAQHNKPKSKGRRRQGLSQHEWTATEMMDES